MGVNSLLGNGIYLSLQSPLVTFLLLSLWVGLGSEILPCSHPSCTGPMRTSACAKRLSWASLLEPSVSSLPLSEDVEETWHRPEVSVTKLYYHNPIKYVWGLKSSSSVWEEGRWGLAMGGFAAEEHSQWVTWDGSLPALIFKPVWCFWLLCQMQRPTMY